MDSCSEHIDSTGIRKGFFSRGEEIENVSSSEPAVTDVESRLLQLKRLRESGLISEDEFSRKRGEILNSL